MIAPTVLKIGGELVEGPRGLRHAASEIMRLAAAGPLVVVHGGGRAIDQALASRGVARQTVDGLRVTDEPTLEVVVAVLAGLVNTRLVAAVAAVGGRPVGLTGADAFIGLAERARPRRSASGAAVDLGLVGEPVPAGPPALLVDLYARGYVPIVASIGASIDGGLLNVNADTWAAHLAAVLGADRLVVAGGTPGVLDEAGRTLDRVDADAIDRLVRSGQASAGMVAKLDACRRAAAAGVGDVRIVDGRGPGPVERAAGTRVCT